MLESTLKVLTFHCKRYVFNRDSYSKLLLILPKCALIDLGNDDFRKIHIRSAIKNNTRGNGVHESF